MTFRCAISIKNDKFIKFLSLSVKLRLKEASFGLFHHWASFNYLDHTGEHVCMRACEFNDFRKYFEIFSYLFE